MTRVSATKGLCPLCGAEAVLHRVVTNVEEEDSVPLDEGVHDVACTNPACANYRGVSP